MCLKVEFYPKEEENHVNFQCLRAEETRVLREKREARNKQNEKQNPGNSNFQELIFNIKPKKF